MPSQGAAVAGIMPIGQDSQILAWIGNRIGKPRAGSVSCGWSPPPEKCRNMPELAWCAISFVFLAQPAVQSGGTSVFWNLRAGAAGDLSGPSLRPRGIAIDVGGNAVGTRC